MPKRGEEGKNAGAGCVVATICSPLHVSNTINIASSPIAATRDTSTLRAPLRAALRDTQALRDALEVLGVELLAIVIAIVIAIVVAIARYAVSSNVWSDRYDGLLASWLRGVVLWMLIVSVLRV